jgi:hypothetical protein
MAAKRCILFMMLVPLALSIGCGERPFADYGLVDPWARKSWREDERFGPTYYTKRDELRARRKTIRSLPPEEQERVAVELAERLREEPHSVLRSEIIRTLALVNSEVAAEALRAAATTDTDADVRVVACQAWGQRGDEQAPQVLAEILGSDTDPDVRLAATKELGRFKDNRQAMQALKLALDENNPAMQYRAVESLKNMSGKDYGTDMLAWKEYVDGGNPPEPPASSVADRLKDWTKLY